MNCTAPSSETLLTKREAALYLKIGVRTLDGWMQRKMLPFFRIGRVIRFRVGDLDAALNKQFRVV